MCVEENTNYEEKEWYKEYEIWLEFYTTFYDANKSHAEHSFISNGYNVKSTQELHQLNLAWIKDLSGLFATLDEISYQMPNAKSYVDEFTASQKVKSKKENFVYEGPCGSANTQVECEERM